MHPPQARLDSHSTNGDRWHCTCGSKQFISHWLQKHALEEKIGHCTLSSGPICQVRAANTTTQCFRRTPMLSSQRRIFKRLYLRHSKATLVTFELASINPSTGFGRQRSDNLWSSSRSPMAATNASATQCASGSIATSAHTLTILASTLHRHIHTPHLHASSSEHACLYIPC